MTLGNKIRNLRESNGLLQRELASRLGIGEAYLSKIENDQKHLKRSDLKRLSIIFKIDIRELEKLWLSNKVYSVITNEKYGKEALENALEYLKMRNT